MRTVDPAQWSRALRKPSMQLARSWRFGARRESRGSASLRAVLQDYRRNCSARGARFLRGPGAFNRWCFCVLLCAGAAWVVGVLARSAREMRSRPPLLVTPYNNEYSIHEINFPAVALCSYNVISQRAVDKYTQLVMEDASNRSFTRKRVAAQLRQLGALVSSSRVTFDVDFMELLARALPNLNITDLLWQLSPRCEDKLRRCSWRGRRVACGALFAERPTPLGFCCVFNSRYSEWDRHTAPRRLDMVGLEHGLAVLLTDDGRDYGYPRRHGGVGYEVLIFEGSEYPLPEGGAVRAFPASINASTFFAITSREQRAAPALHLYSEEWRGCRLSESAHAQDSYSWCLTGCRRAAVSALCACTPALLPLAPSRVPLCGLNHLPCLNKHRGKFWYYYPGKGAGEALSEETRDSLDCACAPDCARVRHSARVLTAPYGALHGPSLGVPMFCKGASLVNSALLRFYYTAEDQQLYTVETEVRWYEVFVTQCGILVLVCGAALPLAAELLFHLTLRWSQHYRRARRQ